MNYWEEQQNKMKPVDQNYSQYINKRVQHLKGVLTFSDFNE